MIKRYLTDAINQLCFENHKIAFLSGPRQCGKTTLAKMLLAQRSESSYHNWDDIEFRRIWTKAPKQIIAEQWGTQAKRSTPLIVLDEIHKARAWKSSLKGVYDTARLPIDILVTGSARLNVYKKGSDSLMGRYYNFRLHPFSLAELAGTSSISKDPEQIKKEIFDPNLSYKSEFYDLQKQLFKFGGFPEPLLAQNERKWRLWLQGRIDKIVREDIRDLSRLLELSSLEMLASLLPERVGSPLSIESLREDLGTSFNTVKRWLAYFYELYFAFELKPYSTKITRSLKREGKLYLWDYSQVKDDGSRFENMIASHLLKVCHFWTDNGEGNFELFYIKNKDKQEIDFLITKDKKPWLPVESKLTDTTPSPHFTKFMKQLTCHHALQITNGKDYYKKHILAGYEIVVASADRILPALI